MNLEEIWKAIRWPLLIVLILLALIFPRPSSAQANCGPRDVLLERLAGQYGEERQSVGLARNLMFEIFANPDTGSWTIVATRAGGSSCVMAAGQSFERVKDSTLEGDPL